MLVSSSPANKFACTSQGRARSHNYCNVAADGFGLLVYAVPLRQTNSDTLATRNTRAVGY